MKEVMRKLLNQLETVILNHLYLQRDLQVFLLDVDIDEILLGYRLCEMAPTL